LEAALADTAYEAGLRAGPRGGERVANVQRLLSLARRFDPCRRQGLYRFLKFVEAQEEEAGEEPAPLPTRNAVRLMTIHRSKVLEFPVVALAGLGGKFNLRDLTRPVALNDVFGLCPKIRAPQSGPFYPSLVHWLAARRERREALGEELRLLYVAMTRARDTLLLVASASGKRSAEAWSSAEPRPLADQELIEAACPLDWLRLWLPQVTRPGDWRGSGAGGNALLGWSIYPRNDPCLRSPGTREQEFASGLAPAEASPEALARLRERLLWRYGQEPATLEPAKATVSALRRRGLAGDDESVSLRFGPAVPGLTPPRSGSSGGRLSAAQRGTAHHLFLELARLEDVQGEIALRNQARRMVEAGRMAAEDAAALDYTALLAFYQSDLGRRVLRQPRSAIHRELPFTARFGNADLEAAGVRPGPDPAGGWPEGEFLVVQGAIDLAVILETEIWLVDFKTDAVQPATLPEKIRSYRPQAALYAMALEKIYRRPVRERWLHFLMSGQSVPI